MMPIPPLKRAPLVISWLDRHGRVYGAARIGAGVGDDPHGSTVEAYTADGRQWLAHMVGSIEASGVLDMAIRAGEIARQVAGWAPADMVIEGAESTTVPPVAFRYGVRWTLPMLKQTREVCRVVARSGVGRVDDARQLLTWIEGR